MPRIKVLLIDDDPAAHGLMKYYFEDRGYETISVEFGKQGLALTKEYAFDIVLTDFQLPDVDGIDLVKQLKEAAPSTEIIYSIRGRSTIPITNQNEPRRRSQQGICDPPCAPTFCDRRICP